MMKKLPGKRVLIVEDNPLLAYDLKDLLADVGVHSVGPAFDLASGLKLAREGPLDAALLDINLGNEMVWPLAGELRQLGVPVIFISAECTLRDFPPEFKKLLCLEKPATNDLILESLAEAVAA
ncbi:response regulator [Qipengyuania sphaerica]|uniref:response regulator n=1 Tax=Qipengyuania sphaerica TaxID=2867243 RepID=UPI001C89660E|nr:response regulator [Qipengyuania sphaerica]MBX7542046.1 response regulator [Qipengyuania sphaerica]